MVSRKAAVLGRVVRSVAEADRPAVTDRELLRRYARENDEAAFAALVARHTAMVLGRHSICCQFELAFQDDKGKSVHTLVPFRPY